MFNVIERSSCANYIVKVFCVNRNFICFSSSSSASSYSYMFSRIRIRIYIESINIFIMKKKS